jgi:histone H3
MNLSTHKPNGKKRTRFYEIYITKLLKQVSSENGITSNAKQQLNSILCVISKLISTNVNEFTKIAKKKTISEKEVINALRILFSRDFSKSMVSMCEEGIKNFCMESDTKGITRQNRAGIIFPPSVAEKYLRDFGYSKAMVNNTAPVALAAGLEYLAGEILNNASVFAKQNKRVRITIRDLELGVRTDRDINSFFHENNLSFLGGGVVPYIHPNLLVKKVRRRKSKKSDKRTHRYRPGTVSIRDIKRFQKASNCLTLAKSPFEKYTRSIIQRLIGDDSSNIKVSKDVFFHLQYFIEQQLVSLLHNAYMASIHAGRVKLTAADISFVNSLSECNTKEDFLINEEVDKEEVDETQKEFDEIDTNNDGSIDVNEFKEWKDKNDLKVE